MLFHEDYSSQVGLDKNSQKLDDTIDDFICNVDFSDDYDNVLSVAELPKRRRSSQISEKVAKKHKNDMSDSSWATGEIVAVDDEDPVSRNDVVAVIGVDVQSLVEVACGSYDEVFEGIGDTQEWEDVMVEENKAQLFPDNEEVIEEEEVSVVPHEDGYNAIPGYSIMKCFQKHFLEAFTIHIQLQIPVMLL